MGPVIGDLLPLAVGIAVSPVPIIAAILMLLSPKARSTSVGFLLGWLTGIIVPVTVFTFLSALLPESGPDAGPAPIAGIIKILSGALLLLLAVKQWRSRPAPGQRAELPKWMSAIESMTAGRAVGLGLLLSAANPKNLLLAIPAGATIANAGLNTGGTITAIGFFTVVGAITVLVPVVAYLLAGSRMANGLEKMRTWLVDSNSTIMSVLLVVIGTAVIGKGISNF
ncbi:GAP family protein [Paenarthrobacter sp. AMU7]|uniref:GAP family protein n=1 Tax=Paenarthrobacter sp. AMU7 TaxID=3162492 RepID=A0AB39YNJ2_9MICC